MTRFGRKYGIWLLILTALALGCKSRGGQPSNPFAMDRATAPPPATFSSTPSYLGQQPGAVYNPQAPASTYPSSSVPAGVPLPSGATVPAEVPVTDGGYGSIGGAGAKLFEASSGTSIPLTRTTETPAASGWTAPVEIVPTGSQETAFQNLDSLANSRTELLPSGETRTVYADADTLVVSSAQVITQVGGDAAPEAELVEPKSIYAGEYRPN